MSKPEFPEIKVKLKGEDGNAFAILAKVVADLRKAGVSEGDIWEYKRRALNNHAYQTYNDFLRVTYETVTVV